jgi:hypothetical protein
MPLPGRPRTPTAVLEMRGSFGKNPQRRRQRENEPVVERGVGDPPACFMIQAPNVGFQEAERLREIWTEIAAEGPYIARSSRGTVETLCRIKSEIRRLPSGSKRLAQLANTEDKLRSSLGLTEASRSRVDAPKNPEAAGQSALAGLAQETRRRKIG